MLSNGFTDESIVETKTGAAWDSRQCETQTRSNGTTYGSTLFDDLVGWSTSGGVSIVNVSSTDPAIGNVLDLSTGSVIGASCFVQRTFQTIPANFGVAIIPALITVGNYLNDALLLQVQKTASDKNMMVRFNIDGVYVFLSGTWTQISTHSNVSFCEWWIEVAEVSGNDVITLYAGTQYVNSLSGHLPTGPSGNSGLVYIGQESQVNNYRHSQVAYFSIGSTQLCDDFVITTNSYRVAVPTQKITATLFVEDVSGTISINTDLTLELSVNGGSYQSVTLSDKGTLCNGIIDSTKPVKILTGALTISCASGSTVKARIKAYNHKFIGLQHVGICPTSTY